MPFLIWIFVVIIDKDKDGEFKWVDKSAVTFSNYGPGWPKDTAKLWDCGQIFTGETFTVSLPSNCKFDLFSFEINVCWVCFLPGNYEGKWETTNCFKSLGFICEMTGGQNAKPTAGPG